LWFALTNSEQVRKCWFGAHFETDWKVGSPWKIVFPDGRVADAGEIVEFDHAIRLVLSWRNEADPATTAEGYSRCSFELKPDGDVVKLTLSHVIERANSRLIEGVSGGWPKILSNLKSLLETGKSILA
jgi:uncharacterized protein YndB with AHSA1/START domain